jgi:hypothetical protein
MASKDKQIAITFTAEQVEDIQERCAAMTPDTAEPVMKPTQYLMMLYQADVARRRVVRGRFVESK